MVKYHCKRNSQPTVRQEKYRKLRLLYIEKDEEAHHGFEKRR